MKVTKQLINKYVKQTLKKIKDKGHVTNGPGNFNGVDILTLDRFKKEFLIDGKLSNGLKLKDELYNFKLNKKHIKIYWERIDKGLLISNIEELDDISDYLIPYFKGKLEDSEDIGDFEYTFNFV